MRSRDERGAVVPIVAVMLTVLVAMTAFTVDIGLQRVARTDMQSVADVVALDLSRELDGRAASAISPTLQAAADRALARNPDAMGDDVAVTPELGTLDADGVFSTVSDTTVPDAVRVTAATSVAFHFTSGSGGASRTAVAVARAQGCYKLGSWGARLSTSANANLLYRALAAHGIGASVGAATYQGLVGAHVDAADLATALGLASPEALGTASVTLSALLTATAQVIGTNGASSGQIAALNTIKADLGTLGSKPVGLANLFSVASGAGSGLSAALDLADLVVGGILVADGNSAVTVDLGSGLPGVGSFTSSVGLIQAARTACGFVGSTPNSSNQASVSSSTTLTSNQTVASSLISGITNLLGVSVSSPTGSPTTLTVTTASATSTLDAISCNASSKSATVDTTGGLLSAQLVVPVRVKVTVVLGSVDVDGTIRATLTPSGTPGNVTITVPSQAYDTAYSNGGSRAQLSPVTVDTPTAGVSAGLVTLTLAQVKTVLNAVASSIVQPLATALNANVIGPLSDLAGLRTSGADVLLLDHPSCTTPALRG
ncbi:MULTISPECIES: pilus assembly protein TadG-related protein [unclassified Nocardioides]|uniref:pilus assembly protein TadG-related protein n=1 Tax=Nocardioides sp. URHA0032 TaxID=1380388 RepID=UPI00048D67EB|nr:pilus assembly protein TadG-related protein [Nocardioides sp. URHA0032]